MLRLIQAEFLKLRRKKFIVLMLLSALFMPLLAVFYFRSADKTFIEPLQFYKWTTFSYTAWIILPVVLGLVSTMLMYDENQNDMLKQLWIIPISKTGYFFSKFIVVLSYSVCFMLLTAIASVFFGMLPGYITFEWNSISYLFKKCIEIAILTAFSILPLLAVAAAGKNYILPVCVTLVYTFLSFILLMVNMYLHPLSSATAIIMRDIPGVILAQEVNIPAALFCIGIWTIVSIVFAYISLKHRK